MGTVIQLGPWTPGNLSGAIPWNWTLATINAGADSTAFRTLVQSAGPDKLSSLAASTSAPYVLIGFSAGGAAVDEILRTHADDPRLAGVALIDAYFLTDPGEHRGPTLSWLERAQRGRGRLWMTAASSAGPGHLSGVESVADLAARGGLSPRAVRRCPWRPTPATLLVRSGAVAALHPLVSHERHATRLGRNVLRAMLAPWRVRGERLEVRVGQSYQCPVPEPGPDHAARTAATSAWLETARAAARRHSVPVSWVLATIYAESGGKAAAIAPDGGVGLMQITPGLFARPGGGTFGPNELLDPATNVDVGASLLGRFRRGGLRLPEAASAYNAGVGADGLPHVSTTSPWGYRETPGHIDRVIRANNAFVGHNRRRSGVLLAAGGALALALFRQKNSNQGAKA